MLTKTMIAKVVAMLLAGNAEQTAENMGCKAYTENYSEGESAAFFDCAMQGPEKGAWQVSLMGDKVGVVEYGGKKPRLKEYVVTRSGDIVETKKAKAKKGEDH